MKVFEILDNTDQIQYMLKALMRKGIRGHEKLMSDVITVTLSGNRMATIWLIYTDMWAGKITGAQGHLLDQVLNKNFEQIIEWVVSKSAMNEIMGMEMPAGFKPLVYRMIEKSLKKGEDVFWEIEGRESMVSFRTDTDFNREFAEEMGRHYIQLNFPDGKTTWFEIIAEDDDILHVHKDDEGLHISSLPGKSFAE